MGSIKIVFRPQRAQTYRAPDEVFGEDLEAWYTPATLYKNDAGTELCTDPGDLVRVWKDLTANAHHLEDTLDEINGDPTIPGPFTYSQRLNGYLVMGSGTADETKGFNGFLQDGFDQTFDYTFLTVMKDVPIVGQDDMPYMWMVDMGIEAGRQIAGDHHPDTGHVFHNHSESEAKVMALYGPGGSNFFHHDSTWRVLAFTLSWTRELNTMWVNGTKYTYPVGLPVQPLVDTGSNADLLVPADPNAVIQVNDALHQTELVIAKGIPTDDKILEVVRYLGRKYRITVA